MKELSKTAKTMSAILKIAKVILKIAGISSLVGLGIIGAYFLLGLEPEQVGSGYNSVELGFLELKLAEGVGPGVDFVLIQTAVGLALACVSILIGLKCAGYIGCILEPMVQGEPFRNTVSINLKKLAKASVLLGVAINVAAIVERVLFLYGFGIEGLLISEKVTHVTVNLDIDLTFLVIAVVFLLLSHVFAYGEQLQQLSDETL